MSKLDETKIIQSYFAPLADNGAYGFLDDAACLNLPEGTDLVITQDSVAENVHFFAEDPADLIARKALRVNLSDLAAKGASPHSISLSLGLSDQCDQAWIEKFASGLAIDCEHYGVSLNGGDTFRTNGGVVISITAIGIIEQGIYVSRLGAGVGDRLYVSGTIGDAALGLKLRMGSLDGLTRSDAEFLNDRYLLPQPRSEIASIIGRFASASMDVSDGLVGDAKKLAHASGCKLQLNANNIPHSPATNSVLRSQPGYLDVVLNGGDDYEILCAVPQNKQAEFETLINALPFPVTEIGKVMEGHGVDLVDQAGIGIALSNLSFDHFGSLDD